MGAAVDVVVPLRTVAMIPGLSPAATDRRHGSAAGLRSGANGSLPCRQRRLRLRLYAPYTMLSTAARGTGRSVLVATELCEALDVGG